jgi:hypothetical protein
MFDAGLAHHVPGSNNEVMRKNKSFANEATFLYENKCVLKHSYNNMNYRPTVVQT